MNPPGRPIRAGHLGEVISGSSPGKRQISTPVETWEQPQPSRIWLDIGLALLCVAASSAVVALTLSRAIAFLAPELWTIIAALVLVAVVCLLAHHDVNRGRIPKRSIRIEEVDEIWVKADEAG